MLKNIKKFFGIKPKIKIGDIVEVKVIQPFVQYNPHFNCHTAPIGHGLVTDIATANEVKQLYIKNNNKKELSLYIGLPPDIKLYKVLLDNKLKFYEEYELTKV